MNDLMSDFLKRMTTDILGDIDPGSGTWSPKGTFILHPSNHNAFHYYRLNGRLYAYTSYPDVHGDYFAWTYKPKGPGARSGKPKRWTAVDIVAFKHKGKAAKRALERLNKARGSHRETADAKVESIE